MDAMKLGPRKYIRSIEFDLDTNKLKDYYNDYTKAYKDLGRFMHKNGFIHRQGSVYNSIEKLSDQDIILLTDMIRNTFDWAQTCIKALDVTDIKQFHDLLPQIYGAGILERTEAEFDADLEEETQEEELL